jgi:hypothetical protein
MTFILGAARAVAPYLIAVGAALLTFLLQVLWSIVITLIVMVSIEGLFKGYEMTKRIVTAAWLRAKGDKDAARKVEGAKPGATVVDVEPTPATA